MIDINKNIRNKALQHISKTLGVSVASLNGNVLLKELCKPELVSIFKRNGFDALLDDIHDVSNSVMLKKITTSDFSIDTVDDYVDYMVECYSKNPKMVLNVLETKE